MLKEATAGFIVGFLGIVGVAAACAPAVAECQLRAVSALPLDDPESITVGEARALGLRLKACQAQGDAGR